MNRFRWPLLILIVCLPLMLLAAGFQLPGLSPREMAAPAPVPAGDFELAWFNTTTSGATWERFVTGVRRAEQLVPGLSIDDTRAFPGQAGVPEIALNFKD